VFSLRDLQGYSIKETSKILNTTPAAIKSRLHRGRFFIKEELRRYLADN
jgi:DNA-directed RNA polymerase specialized sigma24 family protein